jgi:DNA-binding NtrC family response regulator
MNGNQEEKNSIMDLSTVSSIRDNIKGILDKYDAFAISREKTEDSIISILLLAILEKEKPENVKRVMEFDYSKLADALLKKDPIALEQFTEKLMNIPMKELAKVNENEIAAHTTIAIGTIEVMEKDLIIKALENHKGKRKYAAQELGISERTLYRKLNEYNLEKL